MPSRTEDVLSVLHSAANTASISQQNQLKAVCSCNWNKGTLQYRVKFPTGKTNKGKKGETLTGINLIKPCLTDTFPTICRERIPMEVCSQTEVQSVTQSKFQTKHTASTRQDSLKWQKPTAHRQTVSDSKGSWGEGKTHNRKTQTALRHCTSSALPTTTTTHVPTELVLQLKLTYSAYPPPAVIPVFFAYWEENCMEKHNGGDSKVHHHCTINSVTQRMFRINAH